MGPLNYTSIKPVFACFCVCLGLQFDRVEAETRVRLDLNGSEVRFAGQEYYGPAYHINFSKPHFFWDGFASINKNFWGTGIEPGVDHSEFQTKQYDLNLGARQMLYSYYRLDPGQLEFRWLSFGCMDDTGAIDQLFGFGDPGESFWVGFRLEKSGIDKTPYRLAMQVKNFDETTEEVLFLETCPSEPARYVVRRYTDRAVFMINNQVRAVITNEGTKYGVPDIGLEILLSNRQGTAANLDLVKYDSY